MSKLSSADGTTLLMLKLATSRTAKGHDARMPGAAPSTAALGEVRLAAFSGLFGETSIAALGVRRIVNPLPQHLDERRLRDREAEGLRGLEVVTTARALHRAQTYASSPSVLDAAMLPFRNHFIGRPV